MSNETVHVDPHITQYTVYITDSYTGDVVKANVTETQFTFNNQGNVLCPMYRVAAWNSGGEGQLSEPVQESTPRGKQAKDILDLPAISFYFSVSSYASQNFLTGLLVLHHIFILALLYLYFSSS